MIRNIVFTYITPFHPERGGIGRMTHTLTLELQRRGYQVYYLIYECSITVKHVYDYPAPLTYLPSKDCTSKENIRFYHQYLQDHKIDVVINQSGNFSDSELWLNTGDPSIKVISVLHSSPWVAYKHLWSSDVLPLRSELFIEKLKRIARIMLYPRIKRTFKKQRIHHFQKTLPITDIACMLSPNYYDELDEICPGYRHKYRAIANPNSFTEEELCRTAQEKKKVILFVGLFGPPKREDRLVKLWTKLGPLYPDWTLIMVGKGSPKREAYLHYLARKIPNIQFAGFQSPLPYFQQARIFCVTSNYEGWPMVLTEAMQCGTVPIAFNSFAAVTDIIHDGIDGTLVKPFDMKRYECQLRTLMKKQEKLQAMSNQCRENVKRFSVERITDQREALFRELATSN